MKGLIHRLIFSVIILLAIRAFYSVYGQFLGASAVEVETEIATPVPVNRPPIGEVIYSPNERYAADIADFRVYLRNTQTNTYLELDHQGIIPEGFAFNYDSTLLAAYGCVAGTANSHSYCGSQRIVVWNLSNASSTVVAALDEMPLAHLSNIRFIVLDSVEYIAVSGCRQIDDAVLGICHREEAAYEYWSVSAQTWVILRE